jgi:hypothetical protein
MHAYFSNPAALDSLYQEVMDALGEEKKAVVGDKKVEKLEK